MTAMDAYETFTFTKAGRSFIASIYSDGDADPPWCREDGHGEVSEWTTREKRPGEFSLSVDGPHSRFYDFAGAVAKARAEGWGAEGATPGARAAAAAMADFERLRRWCADQWHYCGVSVQALGPDGAPDAEDEFSFALWGIESDCGDYLREVAADLASDAWSAMQARTEAAAAVKRDRVRECLTLSLHCQAPGARDRYRAEARETLAELRALREFLKGETA